MAYGAHNWAVGWLGSPNLFWSRTTNISARARGNLWYFSGNFVGRVAMSASTFVSVWVYLYAFTANTVDVAVPARTVLVVTRCTVMRPLATASSGGGRWEDTLVWHIECGGHSPAFASPSTLDTTGLGFL